jgi:hypothetical protein
MLGAVGMQLAVLSDQLEKQLRGFGVHPLHQAIEEQQRCVGQRVEQVVDQFTEALAQHRHVLGPGIAVAMPQPPPVARRRDPAPVRCPADRRSPSAAGAVDALDLIRDPVVELVDFFPPHGLHHDAMA